MISPLLLMTVVVSCSQYSLDGRNVLSKANYQKAAYVRATIRKWVCKEPNNQCPKNYSKRKIRPILHHTEGAPTSGQGAQTSHTCFLQLARFLASRFGGIMDVLRWGNRILRIVSMYMHPRLPCTLISHRL